ncbi:PadR family transcriptional regulator [Nonomuraea sediminis]|uniref:PadR family transcriptional regulator n=1 Tax=Nonomuraea sediminis TaxID=2835864 RepID=UPI001BDCC27E|nr:PadR family transcriptional regulator [Nonomuraea sediminis]
MNSSPLALTVLAMLNYEPQHPYGIQRRIKQWGKDMVVNVGQRASLYRVIDRMQADGLVTVRETGRDQLYPERTVYEITEAGRERVYEWLTEMLAVPKQEFPQFPAALSNMMLLTPEETIGVLERREQAISRSLAELESGLAEAENVPRVAVLESEYLRAMARTEAQWLRAVIDDIRRGRLSWSLEELEAVAGPD